MATPEAERATSTEAVERFADGFSSGGTFRRHSAAFLFGASSTEQDSSPGFHRLGHSHRESSVTLCTKPLATRTSTQGNTVCFCEFFERVVTTVAD